MGTSQPTPESLNLSASLFTSSISSWIPANFGHVVPQAEADKLWQSVLRSAGEGKDRLGLGHPLIDAPKVGKGSNGAFGRGMQGLEKSLKRGQKQREEHVSGKDEEKAVGEEEEDSRASLIGKRKRPANVDPLAAKKGKRSTTVTTHVSLPALKPPNATASARTSPEREDPMKAFNLPDSDAASPSFPAAHAASADGGAAAAENTPSAISVGPDGGDDTPSAEIALSPTRMTRPNVFGPSDSSSSIPASPAKSKSALKREKKRRAKLAKEAPPSP